VAHVGVVGLGFVPRQRAHEALSHDQRCIDQRGEHPEQQGRVVRVIAGPFDAVVDAVDAVGRGKRLLPRTEDDLVHRPQCAQQPPPALVAVIAVVGDSRRYNRVGDLQQQRPAAAQQQHALAVHATHRAIRRERQQLCDFGLVGEFDNHTH
jgi:hypothetical protein